MRFLRRSLVGIFLLSLTLALFAWAGNTVRLAVQERMSQEPRSFGNREIVATVNVVTVNPETIAPELNVFGEVRSRRTLALRSPVGGTIIETSDAFVEGGAVKEGDLLARIDPTDAETALALANANLRDAQAEVRDAERALLIARDSLTAAEAQATLRQTALERSQNLLSRGAATAADVETAELAVASANSSVLSQRNSVAQAEARVDLAQTALARQEINVAEAQRVVDDTVIYAAFDGTLSGVTLLEGGRVTANEQIAELIDPTALEVAFRVSTAQYSRLIDERGQLLAMPVTAALEVSGVTLEADGALTRESATVGEGLTGRLLYASLEAAPAFRSGDFVTISIAEPELENVALIPATAVNATNDVLVVGEESRLREVRVDILRRQGDEVLITATDLAGQQIVAARTPLLGEGIKIQPYGEDVEVAVAEPEMIALDDERRAKLVSFVRSSPMPEDVKTRMISQLEQPEVSADVVNRIEGRMGG